MTFNVFFTEDELHQWPEYATDPWEYGFNEHIMGKFPYIISVEYASDAGFSRLFQFESEEHYNWFLLTR